MIKFICIFITLSFLSCKDSVTIKELKLLPVRGRSTPGALIVTKGNLIDTIYDCTYSRTPKYKLLYSNGRDYLFTSCDMNGGGNNIRTFSLWSLENENFLDTLFYKEIYTSEVSSNHPKYPEFRKWTQREIDFKFTNQKVTFIIDSIVTSLHWDTAESLDTISMGEKVQVFDI